MTASACQRGCLLSMAEEAAVSALAGRLPARMGVTMLNRLERAYSRLATGITVLVRAKRGAWAHRVVACPARYRSGARKGMDWCRRSTTYLPEGSRIDPYILVEATS